MRKRWQSKLKKSKPNSGDACTRLFPQWGSMCVGDSRYMRYYAVPMNCGVGQ